MSIPQLTAARQAAAIVMPSFVVGQDASGRWVAVETHGLGGGLFRSREDAVHYALAETLKRPDAILIASGPVEFRI
ncbi:hypothetical protein [Methylobacterium brachythecii]|uniref:Uncharacterized protein n=1 Tax=Methylobacterium brachythecii TaxID=1176177 RepID=A0A7W6F8L1_9HYPH|nr:hypothetical protein [Methylobacterium brachythecii]MBB3904564.1 hypothetical protein [Methylobacterium brachythecii]GLS46372.1 hypothetical protein GCM10007884_43660 [Methylobacterium brachythecii]